MLRCCERLVTELAVTGEPDPVVVEAVWTTALLSYARCFAATGDGVALTESDLTQRPSRVPRWWSGTGCCCSCGTTTPTRRSILASVSRSGWRRTRTAAPSGIAITSARQPLVDDLTVRQTGAIAYALSGLVDKRIELRQKEVFDDLESWSKADLDRLDPLDVAAPAGRRRRCQFLTPAPDRRQIMLERKSRLVGVAYVAGPLALLGPAFVAAIAYIDPGQLRHEHHRRFPVRLSADLGAGRQQPDGHADPVPLRQGGHRHREEPG